MLDLNDESETQTENVADESAPTTPAPRRRRAARPAGPPAPVATPEAEDPKPTGEDSTAEAAAPKTPRRSRAKKAPAASGEETGDAVPETTFTGSSTRRRRTTKAPATTTADPAEAAGEANQSVAPADAATATPDQVVESDASGSSEAPAASDAAPPRRTRRRATRPAAAPEPVAEAPSDEATVEAASETAAEVSARLAAEKKPTRSRSRSRRAAVETPAITEDTDPVVAALAELTAAVAAEPDASSETDENAPAEVDVVVAVEEASADEEDVEADEDEVDAVAAALVAAARAAERQPRQRRSSRRASDETVDTEAQLSVLADAISLDAHDVTDVEAAPDEQPDAVDGEEPTEDDVESDEVDSDETAPTTGGRRRRRRGGRRRRRGADEAAPAEDQPSDDGGEDSTSETGADAEDAETSEESSSTRRRRRRRRRSDPSESSSESTGVVRTTAEANEEVTGITGSTRMEAKRQRRKEGRAAGRRRSPMLSEAEFLARRESVTRRMLIRQRPDYTQLAVLEDEVLVEHYVDRPSATSIIGNIYLGRVQNVLPSMEAAFIDIGRSRNAVLYAGEVDWDSFGSDGEAKKIEKVLKSGQTVLVQATKDPVGAKGARLTSHISLPGRYIVYSPGGHLSGISRKLPVNERERLKSLLGQHIGDDASFIVRTAAEGVDEDELVRDVHRLQAQWEVIDKKAARGPAPQLLYAEPDLTLRIVRDLFTEDFTEIVIDAAADGDDAFESVHGYVRHVAPNLVDRVRRWDGAPGEIFAKNRVDEQIAKALERKVFLPSGGSLIIDRTEAMTVIDVNTGKFTGSGGNLEATVTSNNLEAAEEIVRQLRLRDLGGIIVIDFIDMVLPSNRELLLRRLVECLGRDRTRHQVSEVTSLGLVQMTRKRIGTGLAEAFTVPCEVCHGRGYHRKDEPTTDQAQADGGERQSKDKGGKHGKSNKGKGGKNKSAKVVGEAAAQPV